jgi:hypothetical protein
LNAEQRLLSNVAIDVDQVFEQRKDFLFLRDIPACLPAEDSQPNRFQAIVFSETNPFVLYQPDKLLPHVPEPENKNIDFSHEAI